MACDRAAQIHAYHDGELSAERRAAVEAHVRDCADCEALLGGLRAMSRRLSAGVRPEMPGALTVRLQDAWRESRERSVRRLAGWMTAAAAAVLVGTLLWAPAGPDTGVAKSPPWESAAVTEPGTPPADTADLTQVAQWMANDLADPEGR